jgi:hypothetical protein
MRCEGRKASSFLRNRARSNIWTLRDKGKDRAEDVGKGKKKGLNKPASKHKHQKS